MTPLINRNSRRPTTIIIPTGTVAPLHVGGDFFYVYTMSGVVTISVNDDAFAPCQAGLIHSGVVGRNDVERIAFSNTSGATVTVVVIFGKGSMSVTGQVNLAAGDVALITPAVAVLTADFANLSNQAAVNYAGKRSISVTNVGTVQILVGGVALAAGLTVGWSCERTQDTLPAKAVDTSTTPNGAALVVWTAA